jgi:hypothetical protein
LVSQSPSTDDEELGPAFEARFGGICWNCHQWFAGSEAGCEGAMIRARKLGGYQHNECPEAKEPKPTKFQGTTLKEMGFEE